MYIILASSDSKVQQDFRLAFATEHNHGYMCSFRTDIQFFIPDQVLEKRLYFAVVIMFPDTVWHVQKDQDIFLTPTWQAETEWFQLEIINTYEKTLSTINIYLTHKAAAILNSS